MKLRVEPANGLVDVAPVILVEGVSIGSQVTLDVSTTDAGGSRWRSSGSYSVAAGGVLDFDDPDRPWWQMEFEDSQAMTVAFQLPDDSLVYDVQVSAGGDTDRVQVRRLWGTGPRPQEVAGEGWKLRVYRPPGPAASSAAIMLVPGTTGPGTLSGWRRCWRRTATSRRC
jgi:hypothetical protein